MATAKTSQAHKTVVVWRARNQPLLCKRLCETPEPLVLCGTLDVGELKYVQVYPVYSISQRSHTGQKRNLSLALTQTLNNMFGPKETLDQLLKGIVSIGDEDPTLKGASAVAGIALAGSLSDVPTDMSDLGGMLTKLGSALLNEKQCNQVILVRCITMPAVAFAAQDDATLVARVLLAIHGVHHS